MVFQFEHVQLDEDGWEVELPPAAAERLKRSFGRWQDGLAERGWTKAPHGLGVLGTVAVHLHVIGEGGTSRRSRRRARQCLYRLPL